MLGTMHLFTLYALVSQCNNHDETVFLRQTLGKMLDVPYWLMSIGLGCYLLSQAWLGATFIQPTLFFYILHLHRGLHHLHHFRRLWGRCRASRLSTAASTASGWGRWPRTTTARTTAKIVRRRSQALMLELTSSSRQTEARSTLI